MKLIPCKPRTDADKKREKEGIKSLFDPNVNSFKPVRLKHKPKPKPLTNKEKQVWARRYYTEKFVNAQPTTTPASDPPPATVRRTNERKEL